MHEKKTGWRQWTLILIFCVDVHMGLDPPYPSTCVHLSLAPSPLRVDVINGWPLRKKYKRTAIPMGRSNNGNESWFSHSCVYCSWPIPHDSRYLDVFKRFCKLLVLLFWQVLTPAMRVSLVENLVSHLKNSQDFIQKRAIRNFHQVDPEYGNMVQTVLDKVKKSQVSSTGNKSLTKLYDQCYQFCEILIQSRSV